MAAVRKRSERPEGGPSRRSPKGRNICKTRTKTGSICAFVCNCVSEFEQVELTHSVKLSVDADFRPDRVVRVEVNDKSNKTVIEDVAGRKADLVGAKASIIDGEVEVYLQVTRSVATAKGKLTGKVIDEAGHAVKGAIVALAFVGEDGRLYISHESVHRVCTDESGQFTISRVPSRHYRFDMSHVGLIAKKEGFGACEIEPFAFQLDRDDAVQQAPTVHLKRTRSERLLIVSSTGEPVCGAWLEPTGGASLSTLFAKTDACGQCVFDQLPEGYHRVTVNHGEVSETIVLAVGPQPSETVKVIRLRDPERTQPPRVAKVPVRIGDAAPEWDIAEWTDGKTRNLSDLRGKVAVLDFWGIWCGPCRRFFSTLKEIEGKYRDRGVLFVCIHTAGADIGQVKETQQLEGWFGLSGVDRGPDIVAGVSAQRFGVNGFPTFIIVDAKGIVSYNSSTDESVAEKLKNAAAALQLPWPLDTNVDETEVAARIRKVQQYVLCQEVEAALAR